MRLIVIAVLTVACTPVLAQVPFGEVPASNPWLVSWSTDGSVGAAVSTAPGQRQILDDYRWTAERGQENIADSHLYGMMISELLTRYPEIS